MDTQKIRVKGTSKSGPSGSPQPQTGGEPETQPHPIIFGDLRDREAAEQKKLRARKLQLEALKKKRAVLSDDLDAELSELTAKLDKADVVDPLFRAVKDGLNPSVEDHVDGEFGGGVNDPEKQLAAVYGILEADREEPPAYHPRGFTPPFDPGAEERRQRFGKALYSAQGEYQTNSDLFEAVLPILVKLGGQHEHSEIKAVEWAEIVRYLRKRSIRADEPQLGRRVNEALDSIQAVGDAIPPSLINIDLPDLEEVTDTEIVEDNVRSLQPAYFAAMFEELKVFQVVDKLVDLFQNGVLPVGRGEAGNALFKYWKESATRVSEVERRSFYSRTLGFVGGDVSATPNREFNDLWLRFVSGVSALVRQLTVDELLRATVPAAINQQQVRKAARDLATNLSLHGYGMAHFMATELQKQIKDIMKLLSDPDIRNAYGARDMWQVIDQVAALELGGSRNSVRYRTMAASGAIIMAWLADHSRELSSSYGSLIDLDEIRNPSPRPSGYKPTLHPTDSDLAIACDQWLAVTGTQEEQVDTYAQPKEAPNMTSKPIPIPAIARDMLESVGVPAMSLGGNGRDTHRDRY